MVGYGERNNKKRRSKMKVEFAYYHRFFEIALNNYTKIQELVEKRDRIRETIRRSKKDPDEEEANLGDIIEDHTLIVIIFCALVLETYINDYAISRLSKNYLERHLDKLDLASKWIVIPRIITGKQLDKSSKWFSDLSWLISLRNKLVHYKTRLLEVEKICPADFLWEDDAKRALETVKNSVLALKKVDKELKTGWLEYRCSLQGI